MSDQLPLSGIRVLDFTHAVAGSFGSMLLGDLGAEVIKVERPGRGDSSRFMNLTEKFGRDLPRSGGDYFLAINRNKRSITIDLSLEAGRTLALELAAKCDVVLQSFRPGVMERLGLNYDAVKKRNPAVIYGSLSAYGDSGPLSHQPGMDVAVQARSGVMSITGYEGDLPVKPGASLADFSGGVYLSYGVLAAIAHKLRTGEGQLVTCSLLDATMVMLSNYVVAVLDGGAQLKPMGSGHPQIVPFQAFPTSDGHIVISAGTNRIFRDLCRELGLKDLALDQKYATNPDRVRNRELLVALLSDKLRHRSTATWLAQFEAADIPCAPVQTMAEGFADPQLVANGGIVEISHPVYGTIHQVPSPQRYSASPRTPMTPPPLLGEHTDEVLSEILGLNMEQLEDLRRQGVTEASSSAEAQIRRVGRSAGEEGEL